MKNFKRLLGELWSFLWTILFIGTILVAAVVFGLMNQSMDDAIVLIICFSFFCFVAFIAIMIFVVFMLVNYYKSKDKLQQIAGFDSERFDRETARIPRMGNIVLCSDAICFNGKNCKIHVIPIKDIVWVYPEKVQTATFLQIYTNDAENYALNIVMKKKYGNPDMASRFIMRLIARKNKGALIGYKKEYEDMYQNNFRELLTLTQGKEVVDSRWLERGYIENDYYTKDLQ